ncbi:prophage tail fiber N-terminal domain-containing protein [Escherichia coli]|uniref:prophage tail fiber N-terminal domain-containing protein n=1 Tax=Escherichia coli TaxID=562 RepID=UPI0035CFECFC
MAVKISGVLKDGTGKPVQNCTIQLKAKRNSTTVVVNTLASENPDEAGRYSMDVEYGQYSVTERRHRKTGTELHNPAESKT